MRILIISAVPWNTTNSFGNSYSNIFGGIPNMEISNVFLSSGTINDPLVKHAFKISPQALIYNLLGKQTTTGQTVSNLYKNLTEREKNKNNIQVFAENHRWSVLYLMRDLLWRMGKWNSKELWEFINKSDPELLFVPINGSCYVNRIVYHIATELSCPMVGYISDDNYTLRQFHVSPFYWIRRFALRYEVRRIVSRCKILYVISDIQKREYDQIFQKDCRILTKGIDFAKEKPAAKIGKPPYHMVFTGNIGSNRWKSLALIGKAIQKINAKEVKIDLTIYTSTPLTKKMYRELNVPHCIGVAGELPYQEVAKKQAEADVLIHVEATDIVYRWVSHQGFSTKLVDYMASNRPILAYGLEDQASIAHLKQCDAAMVATTPLQLEEWLRKILEDSHILQTYADNAWKCGEEHHDIRRFHKMLEKDFNEVVKS